MRYVFLAFSMLSYASLLGPAFLHLWMYAGSGNANFFYAITLVYSLAQIILVADALYGMLRVDWEQHEGSNSTEKDLEIIQI
jgi:GPI-anchor transamidase subunit U